MSGKSGKGASDWTTYFKAAQAGAVVGMIGAAAGAIGGMAVGALELGTVGALVVAGVVGGLSAGASTLATDAIMNVDAPIFSPFGQMISGKPIFSDGIFDQARDNTLIFGAGGMLGAYGMSTVNSQLAKLLIGIISPVPFAMAESALDDEGTRNALKDAFSNLNGFFPPGGWTNGPGGGFGGGIGLGGGLGGGLGVGLGLNMLLFSDGMQLLGKTPALVGAGAAGGTYGGTTAVLGGNAGAAAGNSAAAAVNPAVAARQMALYNQLAGGLAAIETITGHLNREEAARQQKVLDQARERFRELAEAEEKYISANIKSRAEALAAVEAMMREYGLTQSQYEAIRDALIAQNVISATAGQAYAGAWEDLLYGDLAEYGVGYAPVLGNIYFAKEGGEAAAGESALAGGAAVAGSPNPEDPNGGNDDDDNKNKDSEFDMDKLSRSQRKAIESAENIINDHLKESDLSAALGDLQGKPIPKPGGGYWDHAQEVRNAYPGLLRAKRTLEGSLKNPNLDLDVRTYLQDKYDLINKYIKIIEDIFAPYGGI